MRPTERSARTLCRMRAAVREPWTAALPDCYAAMGDPVERKAGCGAERAVRRQVCEGCGGDLAAYSTTGRKERQTTLFCSPACRRRAHRSGACVRDDRPGGV
jgi:hypothetical protein